MVWLSASQLPCVSQGERHAYSKCSAVGQANWEVCDNSEKSIAERGLEGQVVGNLMNRQKEVLVCSGANDVGREKKLEGKYGRILQAYCTDQLEQQHQEDKVFGQRLRSAKLRYLICMSMGDLTRPRCFTSG